MSGIVTKHYIDLEYFKVGEAYHIRFSSNNFKNCILIKANEDCVTFAYFEKGEVKNITWNTNDLMYHDYWIVKLQPDYVDGKFEYKV